jgi:hypothetical protein
LSRGGRLAAPFSGVTFVARLLLLNHRYGENVARVTPTKHPRSLTRTSCIRRKSGKVGRMRRLVPIFALIVLAVFSGCKKEETEAVVEVERPPQPTVTAAETEQLQMAVEVDSTVPADFEKFRHSLKKVTIDQVQQYIVEGDVLLDDDELKLYYLRLRSDERTLTPSREIEPRLIVVVGPEGRPIRWPSSTPLTYTVLRQTFRTDAEYNTVVNAIGAAADDWERWCAIDFQHRVDLDSSSGVRVPGVVFVVRGIDASGAFIADAFPPNAPEIDRRILVDWSYFTTDYDRIGVFRHELGHVMGFRHEHIRALPTGIQPNCPPEDTAYTQAITNYDAKSVMHYPCQGVENKEFLLSDDDKAAAASLYGPPGNPRPAPAFL